MLADLLTGLSILMGLIFLCVWIWAWGAGGYVETREKGYWGKKACDQ